MCLSKTSIYPKIAKKDILCYKIAKQVSKGELIRYKAPYQIENHYYELNSTQVAVNFKDCSIDRRIFHGYHSFRNWKSVKKEMLYWELYRIYHKMVVIECIIPKSTRYYKGRFEPDTLKCFASEKLRFTNNISYHSYFSSSLKNSNRVLEK